MRVRMLITATLAVAVACVAARSVCAQTCAGLASYEMSPFRISANGSFNDDATSFSGGLGFGGRGLFGGLGIGTVHIDDLDGSGFGVSGSAGYEASLDSRGIAYLCPVAAVGVLFGPNDILGLGLDYSETDFGFGLSFGVMAGTSEEFRVVPTGGLSLNVARGKLEDEAGNSESETETFGMLDLGMGLIINGIVSFKPFVAIPFGLEDANASFGLTVAVNFGRSG